MGSYRIEWRASARREIRRIGKQHLPRIIEAVATLADDPRPAGCTKMTGSERAYRIRVGNYRVIYEIFEDAVLIEIVRVGHRRDVYR